MKGMLALGITAFVVCNGTTSRASAESIVETRAIDHTFHEIKIRRQNIPTGPYMVYNYLKAEQHDGQLMICGGYTGELTGMTSLTYSDALRNHDSYLIVGNRDDAAAPRISPLAFMKENISGSPRLEDMKATCIATDYPWKPDYATSRFYMYTPTGRKF